MHCSSETAQIIEQGFYSRSPFGEIRRPKWLVRAVWKIQIGDFQVALGAVRCRGFGVDFLAETVGGFAYEIARADVAHDGRVEGVSVDHRTVVPHPRLERRVHIVGKNTGQHHIGVGRGEQETTGLELVDFVTGGAQGIAQRLESRFAHPFGMRYFRLQRVQSRFAAWQKRVYQFGLLGPAIARQRLESRVARIHGGKPVGVLAVGIDVHIRLEQQGGALGLRMPQLQDRFAIKEIVPRKQEV